MMLNTVCRLTFNLIMVETVSKYQSAQAVGMYWATYKSNGWLQLCEKVFRQLYTWNRS